MLPRFALFTKLKKGGFIIDTPYSNYSPGWAVIYKGDNQIKLYFIVETKFDKKEDELQNIEERKIKCAELHFKNIDIINKFDWVNSYQNFKSKFNVKDSI